MLFVDLENFTSLSESLDPEELRTIQSRYFELARSVVAAYGGTIEKFIGDAVMAVWGAPVAHEDDAERAVRAALQLVRDVPRIVDAAAGASLGARAAVTTGQAAVTLGAINHGMVAGDLVNTAARLQLRAPVNGVIVDDATRQLAPAAGTFERMRPMRLKGRRSSIRAYRVTRGPARNDARAGGHAGPFVGRDREMRELVDVFDAVVRDRRIRLVSIIGIAGIGKSRLAWELARHVNGLDGDVAWHAGRAPAYGNDTAFAAVEQMIRRRVRLTDDTPPAVARRQLASALREVVPDAEERRWIEPRLAVLLERQGVAAFERDELFAAWRRFFERVSDRWPTVLLFEDLQWADPGLIAFVEHLATWARDHPILVMTSARPELLDSVPAWGTARRSFTAIHLDRLPDAAMLELLRGHAPDLEGQHQILDHAGGVPLYAVEVARMLQRGEAPIDGDRRRGSRTAAADRRPGLTRVPDSLHGLIAARIDALDAAERRLLMAASVLGRRFTFDALAAIIGIEPSALRAQVETLLRREFLAFDEELRSPGRGQLHFVQELVREVAYQTLSRAARRALHVKAARFLDGLADDDSLAESRATHLLEAHRLAPEHPDAPRLARRAIGALRQAAHDATRLHVPERAYAHLEVALRLARTSEERTLLLTEVAAAAAAADRLESAERHLRALVAEHDAASRPREAAQARARLAGVLLTGQQNATALAELESAVRAIGDPIADEAGVELAAQLARARVLVGDDEAGLSWAQQALEAAERLGLSAAYVDVLITHGTARFNLGDQSGGLDDLRRAIEAAQAANSLSVELRARNNLAWLSVADDPRLTFETAQEAVSLATAMGVGDMAAQLASVACAVAIDTGDWDWSLGTAADLEQRGIADAHRIDLAASSAVISALRGDASATAGLDRLHMLGADTDAQLLASVDHARAWSAFVGGDFPGAHRLAERAAGRSLGIEQHHHRALSARSALWAGDAEAGTDAVAALRALPVAGRAVAAATLTLEAGLLALGGDPDARDRYRQAAEQWRALELPPHLVLCLVDQHRLMPGADEPVEALGLIERLGAEGLLRLVIGGTALTRRGASGRPARSRRPSARTERRSDETHRQRPAPDPGPPRG